MPASILLLAPAAAAAAAPLPAGTAPPVAPTVVQVPADRGPQDAVVLERVFPVGGQSGWHTHPGYEIGHVVSGETEMRTAQGVVRYKAGETFVIPRGTVHNGVNPGGAPTVLVITYLVDRGVPVRSDAPALGGR